MSVSCIDIIAEWAVFVFVRFTRMRFYLACGRAKPKGSRGPRHAFTGRKAQHVMDQDRTGIMVCFDILQETRSSGTEIESTCAIISGAESRPSRTKIGQPIPQSIGAAESPKGPHRMCNGNKPCPSHAVEYLLLHQGVCTTKNQPG